MTTTNALYLSKEDFVLENSVFRATFDPPIDHISSWRLLQAKVVAEDTDVVVSNQDILNLQPSYFFDWESTAKISRLGGGTLVLGAQLASIVSENTGDAVLFAGQGGMVWSVWGQSRSVYNVSSQYHTFSDGSSPNPLETENCAFFMGFTTPATQTNLNPTRRIWNSKLFQIKGGPVLSFEDAVGVTHASTLALQPGTEYLLKVVKTGTQHACTLRKMNDGTEQTQSLTINAPPPSTSYSLGISTAQTGWRYWRVSHVVNIPSTAPPAVETVENWFLGRWSGAAVPATGRNNILIRSDALTATQPRRNIAAPSGRDRHSNIIALVDQQQRDDERRYEFTGSSPVVYTTSSTNTIRNLDLSFHWSRDTEVIVPESFAGVLELKTLP